MIHNGPGLPLSLTSRQSKGPHNSWFVPHPSVGSRRHQAV